MSAPENNPAKANSVADRVRHKDPTFSPPTPAEKDLLNQENGRQIRVGEEALNSRLPRVRHPAMPALVALGIAVWCISVMAIGLNLAGSAWEWAWILAFGTAIPSALLWQTNRLLASQGQTHPVSGAKREEKELLEALAERGEITPVTAAMRTSLTADRAAAILQELSSKGYLRLRVEDGVEAYALREPDLPGPKGTASMNATPGDENGATLDEPLSERELEVLALLATGRTNREIASDLFVTVGTVKSHTSNIYGKLGAHNRTEALATARSLRLIK